MAGSKLYLVPQGLTDHYATTTIFISGCSIITKPSSVVPMSREPLRICKGFPAYTISSFVVRAAAKFQQGGGIPFKWASISQLHDFSEADSARSSTVVIISVRFQKIRRRLGEKFERSSTFSANCSPIQIRLMLSLTQNGTLIPVQPHQWRLRVLAGTIFRDILPGDGASHRKSLLNRTFHKKVDWYVGLERTNCRYSNVRSIHWLADDQNFAKPQHQSDLTERRPFGARRRHPQIVLSFVQ
ncbi:hypothetical protein K503DRAFT_786945 [Rhizopogon vinicolor AM-OR11-026]|uniref:Uncharacterized protein n=1 Tax=Rhizopogon vinicolor AM-OR11-026 TaxID=1314800 RepID=A0A1B7MJN2_9AGAM|nr:hypothetical protein K503DRAFT_786945 [Rhizopogon vinicolor AM-OR11-026]